MQNELFSFYPYAMDIIMTTIGLIDVNFLRLLFRPQPILWSIRRIHIAMKLCLIVVRWIFNEK